MTSLNTITYHNRGLAEGPQNFFKLTTGVKPSFGFFRASKSLVDYVLSAQGGAAGELTFTSPPLKLPHDPSRSIGTVTLKNIYLVKSASVEALKAEVCDIVLADERIRWQFIYGTSDYNTYKTDRAVSRDLDAAYCYKDYEGGEKDFELDNINTETEEPWTFSELLTEINSRLGVTIEMSPECYAAIVGGELNLPYRRPRNILGKNLPVPCILQQFLLEINGYLAFDPVTTGFTIYPVGAYEVREGSLVDDAEQLADHEVFLTTSREIRINPLVQQGKDIETVMAADPTQNTGDRLVTYGPRTNTTGWGKQLVQSSFAVFGEENNKKFLEYIGNELSSEYIDAWGNVWRDATYGGIITFTLNRAVHEITWVSNIHGATTRIKSYRPRPVLPEELKDTLFAYSKFLLAGGGGISVQWAKIIQGLVLADPTDEACPDGISKYYGIPASASPTVWGPGKQYKTGDQVTHTPSTGCLITRMYKCKEDHTSSSFQTELTAGKWELDDLELMYIAMEKDPGSGEPVVKDLRNYVPWFLVDEYVPYIERSGENYIWQTLTYCGEVTDKSIAWLQDEKRVAAVYK